jgi:hypothetical protein
MDGRVDRAQHKGGNSGAREATQAREEGGKGKGRVLVSTGPSQSIQPIHPVIVGYHHSRERERERERILQMNNRYSAQ